MKILVLNVVGWIPVRSSSWNWWRVKRRCCAFAPHCTYQIPGLGTRYNLKESWPSILGSKVDPKTGDHTLNQITLLKCTRISLLRSLSRNKELAVLPTRLIPTPREDYNKILHPQILSAPTKIVNSRCSLKLQNLHLVAYRSNSSSRCSEKYILEHNYWIQAT